MQSVKVKKITIPLTADYRRYAIWIQKTLGLFFCAFFFFSGERSHSFCQIIKGLVSPQKVKNLLLMTELSGGTRIAQHMIA